MTQEDLLRFVTAPVNTQVNLNGVEILTRLGELQEAVESIARQISREISRKTGNSTEREASGKAESGDSSSGTAA